MFKNNDKCQSDDIALPYWSNFFHSSERTAIQTEANGLSRTIQIENMHDFPLHPVNIIRQINVCTGNQITDSLRETFLMTKVPLQVAQMKKSDFPVTRKRSFLVEWIKQYPSIRFSIAIDRGEQERCQGIPESRRLWVDF